MIVLKKWAGYFMAYVLWAAFIALGFLWLVLARTGLYGLLQAYYVKGNYQRGNELQFVDRIFFLAAGLILLISYIVVEQYFRHGAQRGRMIGRALRVIGVELVVFFSAHFSYAYLTGFNSTAILGLAIEILAGGLMAFFGFRTPVK